MAPKKSTNTVSVRKNFGSETLFSGRGSGRVASEMNAEIIQAVLEGEAGPKQDIVLLNASAAICAGGKAGFD